QQRQAADQVSIGNIVTSMQLLSGLDWRQFFERVSLVEQVLRRDPAHIYEHLEFASRDEYRHVVERLAKRSRMDESQVARLATAMALEAERRELPDARRRHVGFFLIAEGRLELEQRVNYRPRAGELLSRAVRRHAETIYLGAIGAGTAAGVAIMTMAARMLGASPWVAGLIAGLAILPASELTMGLVNFLVTNLLRPRPLPKIEFKGRIQTHCQTLVGIPSMLTSEHGIDGLLERLEIHFLANPDEGLQFALLTDFADARHERMPVDGKLLNRGRAGIRALNARYAGP